MKPKSMRQNLNHLVRLSEQLSGENSLKIKNREFQFSSDIEWTEDRL